ncbi:MAG: hypothetical protein K6T83_02450 [Alicyclobacillus sp.]|nr:hypothetical protein [Alicyclobacillus sp.]
MPNETSTKKRLSATVYYLLIGLALGWPGLLASGVLLPSWHLGEAASPLSLAAIHLLVLGSMLTVAFGVLYQIVPIAFQAPTLPRHVLSWHLPLHVASVIVMVVGFMTSQFLIVGIGGTLLLLSAVAYFILVGRSYIHARNKTTVHKGLTTPLSALWLAILIGLFQAFFPARVNESVILTHMLLGGFAFWGGLVLVFSYKLVPMFVISHGYQAAPGRNITLYFVAVAVWLVSNWWSAGRVERMLLLTGGILLLVSLALYVWDMIAIVRARKKKRIVLPMYDAFLAMAMLVLGETGVVLSVLCRTPSLLYPSVYLFGFGGLMALMFAYMQKIVPFLWFEYRFSKRPERKTAPLIDDMVPKRTAQVGMFLYFIGVLAGTLAMLQPYPSTLRIAAQIGAVWMTAGSILLFFSLRYVLTIGGPRPANDPV